MEEEQRHLSAFDIPPRFASFLQDSWGITHLHPPQAEAAPGLLKGRNTLVAIPTASGKSLLAYMAIINRLAASHDRAKAIYIVPLKALAMEKFLTGLMLMMIVMIGAVNIVSTLVMAVAEKTSDIAILRTMGASSGAIMRSFIMQGGVSGVLGTFFGAGLGVFIALFLAPIGLALESALGALLGQPNLLLVSHLQTKLLWSEVLLVCGLALLISLLATLYPAFRASRIAPAEVLRYE